MLRICSRYIINQDMLWIVIIRVKPQVHSFRWDKGPITIPFPEEVYSNVVTVSEFVKVPSHGCECESIGESVPVLQQNFGLISCASLRPPLRASAGSTIAGFGRCVTWLRTVGLRCFYESFSTGGYRHSLAFRDYSSVASGDRIFLSLGRWFWNVTRDAHKA